MSNAVAAVTEHPKRSVLMAMSEVYGMEPAAFEQTLRATVVPRECTKEQFAAFLLVAKHYELNPLLKEIYAFPTRGGGIQPIVPIDGWTNIINSNPQLDGIEFDDHLDEQGGVMAITARIWRKDRSKPIVVTEYMAECKRPTDTWKTWPRRMLRHKALIQCARYAFGFSGIVDPDEAERNPDVTGMKTVSPAPAPEPPAPPPPVAKSAPKQVAAKPAPDDLEPPAYMDRRPKPERKPDAQTVEQDFGPAGPIEDPDAYLKDLEAELGQAESLEDLGDRWAAHEVQAHRLLPPDRDKAQTIFERNEARLTPQWTP